MSCARAILDAETPKGVLKAAAPIDKAKRAFIDIGFERVNDYTWRRLDVHDANYQPLRTPIMTTIWWDAAAREWCRKRELKFRNGSYKQLSFDAHADFDDLYPFY